MKSFVVVVLEESKSLLKLVDVKGENVLFKSGNGWRNGFCELLPVVNGSNALKRRFVDETDDDVDDADDEGNDEKCGWRIDWFCGCWLFSDNCDGGKSGNLLLIPEEKCGWSINSVIQFEQSFDKGLFDEDVAITIGISFRHDEHTPPVLPLFILLVSFMISSY